MTRNMGLTDRGVRLLLAVVAAVILALQLVSGWLAIVLGVVIVMLAVTSTVAWCPLYLPFGWSTKGKDAPPAP